MRRDPGYYEYLVDEIRAASMLTLTVATLHVIVLGALTYREAETVVYLAGFAASQGLSLLSLLVVLEWCGKHARGMVAAAYSNPALETARPNELEQLTQVASSIIGLARGYNILLVVTLVIFAAYGSPLYSGSPLDSPFAILALSPVVLVFGALYTLFWKQVAHILFRISLRRLRDSLREIRLAGEAILYLSGEARSRLDEIGRKKDNR